MPHPRKLAALLLFALVGMGPDRAVSDGPQTQARGVLGSPILAMQGTLVPGMQGPPVTGMQPYLVTVMDPGILDAAMDSLPRVHLLATGGTISNTEGDRLTGEDLVREIPALGAMTTITVEQFSNVASGSISLDQWMAMSRRIDALFAEDAGLSGVVITHGTDTMEETAFFLDLTLADCRPVVVTGAMRRAGVPGADGPANLLNAFRLAVDPAARELGSVVLMNDEIFAARNVAKVHTSRLDAFAASDGAPIGVTDPDAVVLMAPRVPRSCGTAPFDLSEVGVLPRVDIVTSYLGSDGALIRAAVAAGAEGIVLATVGRGGSTPGERNAVREAREAGVVVVRSSRTGAGRVPVGSGSAGGGSDLAPSFGAGDLTPVKARILLMLALATGAGADELRAHFEGR